MEEDSIIKKLILNITDSVFNKKDDSPEKFNLDYKLKSFIPNPEIKNPMKKSDQPQSIKAYCHQNCWKAGFKEYNKLKCGKVDLAEKM